jgi:hypothetical protein
MPSFCRIEGSNGYITVEGSAPSIPDSFTVSSEGGSLSPDTPACEGSPAKTTVKSDQQGGRGSFWEADVVALDIAVGRKQNTGMLSAETIKIMEDNRHYQEVGRGKDPQGHG